MKTIREALKAKFEQQRKLEGGLTQTELGASFNVSQPQISRYFSGEDEMSEEVILSICRALGIRWQDLDVDIEITEEPKRQQGRR